MTDRFEEFKFDRRSQLRVSELGAFAANGLVDFVLRVTPSASASEGSAVPDGIEFADLLIHEDAWNSGRTTFRRFHLDPVPEKAPDGEADPAYALFARPGSALWKLTFDFRAMLPHETEDGEGLFYYHYAVRLKNGDTLILGGERPTELGLLEDFVGERQLLLTRPGFRTSAGFREGPVYHIFVDRFRRSGRSPVKEGAVLDPDWDGGIPQYGPYPGAEVSNNVFFGGDLWGVAEKLPYIRSLGVKTIYLSPVFDAYSNHKYDTGDYMKVDVMFGGDEALAHLCREAEKAGIGVILDGVFNHTGADSLYFNRYGRYPTVGAYQSKKSPWSGWYSFSEFPDKYECWWGVKSLPRVNSAEESYRRFICGEVIKKWTETGVAGWRLDVADELSDVFLDEFREAAKTFFPDSVVIGEVWEDASDKISYGKRRRYLSGGQLDSVMNYPLRNGLIEYVLYGNAEALRRVTEGIYRRYPKEVSDNLLNLLGTHDTERILTVLGGEPCRNKTNAELSTLCMSARERKTGIGRLRLAYGILCGLPGVPCIFYGDEAGMEGYRDPFCRRPFPWNKKKTRADEGLTEFYRTVGQIRREEPVFRDGRFRILSLTENSFIFLREPWREESSPVLVAAVRKGSLRLRFGRKAVSLSDGKKAVSPSLGENEVGYYRLPDDTDTAKIEWIETNR
jgi:glycosidase